MELDEVQLSRLVDMKSPQRVMEEVSVIVGMLFDEFDFGPLNSVFRDVLDLFNGRYPGYRECNLKYHDLHHTTDILLAMVRLIHGATVDGQTFSKKGVSLGLISAFFHDTGYIQTADDLVGTGAKYTMEHIGRSVDFMSQYFTERGYSLEDIQFCGAILRCTGLSVKIDEIRFSSLENEILGKMLGTADLLGQMANRAYLEKLPHLYGEFKEGKVPGFKSETELLKKTVGFYDLTKERFENELGGVHNYMHGHFKVRWGIDGDLYGFTIADSIRHLKYVLENHQDDYRRYLRRNGKRYGHIIAGSNQ